MTSQRKGTLLVLCFGLIFGQVIKHNPTFQHFISQMDVMEPQNVPCQVNAENQLEKRKLIKRLPVMNELSLINP